MLTGATNSSEFPHVFEPGDADSPTLLLLHGTGGSEYDLLPLGRAIAPGSGLLSVRGKVLENGAPRFFRRIAEGVFNQADLAFRTTELNSFLKSAVTEYALDPGRLVAVGFSNGANMAASLLLRYPEVLGGAVLLRAMIPFQPSTPTNLQRRPVLLLSGIADPIVSATEGHGLEAILNQAHAHIESRWIDAGHALTEEDVKVTRKWLRRFYGR